MIRTPRCLLFVPAHVAKMIAKAVALPVDAVVLDLEDAVPVAQKDAARRGSRQYLEKRPGHAFVRINPMNATTPYSTGCGWDDIQSVVMPGLRGIVLPKAEGASDVEQCNAAITQVEKERNLPGNSVELYVIVETAKGVIEAVSIARTRLERPFRLCFGAGDFTTDIGVDWTRMEEESRVARSLVVIASRAAGLPQPIDSVFADISDQEGLSLSAQMARQLGYCGKFVIHPSQIAGVERAFSPTDEQASWAREVIAGLAEAERSGAGAFVVRGKMIDYPIVERARRLLERWEDLNKTE